MSAIPPKPLRDYGSKFWAVLGQSMRQIDVADETEEFDLFAQEQLQIVLNPYFDILVSESETKPEDAVFTHLKRDAEHELIQCQHLRTVIVKKTWNIAQTWLSENREGALQFMENKRDHDFTIPTLTLCINSLMSVLDQRVETQTAKPSFSSEQILTYAVASAICIGIIALWEIIIGKSTDEIECLQDEQLNFYLLAEESLWIEPFNKTARILLTLPLECLPEVGNLINELYTKVELCMSDAQRAIKQK